MIDSELSILEIQSVVSNYLEENNFFYKTYCSELKDLKESLKLVKNTTTINLIEREIETKKEKHEELESKYKEIVTTLIYYTLSHPEKKELIFINKELNSSKDRIYYSFSGPLGDLLYDLLVLNDHFILESKIADLRDGEEELNLDMNPDKFTTVLSKYYCQNGFKLQNPLVAYSDLVVGY